MTTPVTPRHAATDGAGGHAHRSQGAAGRHLDYYRATVLNKLEGMSEKDLRSSRLPSGWTPLALLRHLTFVELRWLRWGFLAEEIDDPWGDDGPGGVWAVPDETTKQVIAAFQDQCERSRKIVAAASLDDVAQAGGRFDTPESPPALVWILFHLVQEYARHAGHLDVARELADGSVGE
jgi:hypothetical protein